MSAGKVVAAPAVFGGMHSKNRFAVRRIFQPNHRVGRQPVVRVNDIEAAHLVLRLQKTVHERAAHIHDIVLKMLLIVINAPVVTNTVDPLQRRLILAHAGKDMHLMAFAGQRRGQIRNVNRDTAYSNTV